MKREIYSKVAYRAARGVYEPFDVLYLVLLLAAMAGSGVGLLVSALARTGVQAATLVPVCLLPQIMLAGAILPLYEMPAGTRWLSWLTASRWGFEAALHLEYYDDDLARYRGVCGIAVCDSWGSTRPASRDPACLRFCPALRREQSVTPLDHVFGPDPDAALRKAWRLRGIEPRGTARTSTAAAFGALILHVLLLLLGVAGVLRARDR